MRERACRELAVRRAHCLPVISLGAAVAGVLLGTARIPDSGPTAQDVEQVAADIDVAVRSSAAGVSARTQTLAELPRLALAVATDRQTVDDLTDEELAFQPRADETIELAQLPRAGGSPVSLLRRPAGAATDVPLGPPGIHLLVSRSTLRIASIVRVQPRERAGEVDGVLAVSWPVDLSRVNARLAALGTGMSLETPGGALAIGGVMQAEQGTTELALTGPTGQVLRLVAPAPGPASWRRRPVAAACAAVFAALLVSLLICRRAGRSRRTRRPDGRLALGSHPPISRPPTWREWTPPPPPSPYPPERGTWTDAARRLPLRPPDRLDSEGDAFGRRGSR
jgi:hypothetical protein